MSIFSENLKINGKTARVIAKVENKLFTWLEGSAQSGKSVAAVLAFAALIENSKPGDDLYLVLAYTSTSAWSTAAYCGGYGLQAYFSEKARKSKYFESDALLIDINGVIKTVVFMGAANSSSNEKFHGWPVSGFLVDEIDRLHENSITEMQQRIQAKPNARIIVTMNPNTPRHPIYKLLYSFAKKNQVSWYHYTLKDNMSLSDEDRQTIINRYDPTTLYYKRYILGQRVNPDGQIFNLKDSNILESFNPSDYIRYLTILDLGENQSATYMMLLAITSNKDTNQFEMHILKEYHHLNANLPDIQKKHYMDYIDDYGKFIRECADMMGKNPEYILYDGSNMVFRDIRNILPKYRLGHLRPYAVSKDNDEERIKRVSSYLHRDKLRISKSCPQAISDVRFAEYDEKAYLQRGKIAIKNEFTAEGHLDALDCVSYGTFYYSGVVK